MAATLTAAVPPLEAMTSSVACPSCRQPMAVQRFTTHLGQPLELDLCYPCQGMWIDRYENLKLTPDGVVELFRLLHEHRAEQHQPLAAKLTCPRCVRPLDKGFDVVRRGRYITHRCAEQHGRFSSFSSFMIEKGFVRHMTRPEIDDLAKRVEAIYCSAAFSLLDPQAVALALEGYAQASGKARTGATQASALDIGDALVASARDRSRTERERVTGAFTGGDGVSNSLMIGDLLTAGVAMVWRSLQD